MTALTIALLIKNSALRPCRSLLIIVLLILAGSMALSQQASDADLLLLNANVITMNERQPRAQAIAIKGERIAWIGNNAEARKLFPHPSRQMDLNGAAV